MATYDYPDDGNIHTRYSELSQCLTPAGAYAIAEQKLGIKKRIETAAMRFGTERHKMWEEEGLETGLIPACFADNLDFRRHLVEAEQHRATEIFKGIIFHFTIDAVIAEPAPVDYKTATLSSSGKLSVDYTKSLQVPTYALLLRPHGYACKSGYYLIEMWNRERTEIMGYRMVEKKIGLHELAQAKQMLKTGTENLLKAMDLVAKHNGL